MKGTELSQRQIESTRTELVTISKELASYSVPFPSPRYIAHMSMECSMPSVMACTFTIELCSGESELFAEYTIWELRNLKPSTVLSIPTQLYEFGVLQTAPTNASTDFSSTTDVSALSLTAMLPGEATSPPAFCIHSLILNWT
ncbi:hypothetical protein G647_01639 [Cladophialophora carrionii CBS 160.54]|uniref:Uncharacterized protein n=1 Tax=Cladophialophora carrionii CBS 160.54 TaxID=1279043 RepID=V9DR93_9EURO|nr:uncharacterized protein G647_01639 [Cladophialophora carrionii CBS 160.54]ETI29186.1 hypothetical protein G647_01639 [Cladophialophora carrionii CBS 160.54]